MRGVVLLHQVWVHEQADGKLDIVDGKQRITSLLSYLDGIFPRTQQRFALEASSWTTVIEEYPCKAVHAFTMRGPREQEVDVHGHSALPVARSAGSMVSIVMLVRLHTSMAAGIGNAGAAEWQGG